MQLPWGIMDDLKLISAIYLLADEISQLRAELKSTNKKSLLTKERKGWKEKADQLVAQMNERKERGDC